MGSITDAIMIPVGSADTVLAGLINSVAGVISGFGALVGEALGSLGSGS